MAATRADKVYGMVRPRWIEAIRRGNSRQKSTHTHLCGMHLARAWTHKPLSEKSINISTCVGSHFGSHVISFYAMPCHQKKCTHPVDAAIMAARDERFSFYLLSLLLQTILIFLCLLFREA